MRIDLKNGVIIRDTDVKDIDPIVAGIRKSDADEIWASHRHTPLQALTISFYSSVLCFTVELDGKQIAMFGVVPESFLGSRGSIWLLATNDFEKIRMKLGRYSKNFIKYMLWYYPNLDNYVDARNVESLSWLKWCGAEIDEAKPFGLDKIPFYHFSFKRKALCQTH